MIQHSIDLTGVVVSRPKMMFGRHYGLCVDPGCSAVSHNHPNPGFATYASFDTFSAGHQPTIHFLPSSKIQALEVTQRAIRRHGTPYALTDECEDHVSVAVTGRAGSPQRDTVLGILMLAGLICIAIGD